MVKLSVINTNSGPSQHLSLATCRRSQVKYYYELCTWLIFFSEANQETQLLALHKPDHENFTIESLFFLLISSQFF